MEGVEDIEKSSRKAVAPVLIETHKDRVDSVLQVSARQVERNGGGLKLATCVRGKDLLVLLLHLLEVGFAHEHLIATRSLAPAQGGLQLFLLDALQFEGQLRIGREPIAPRADGEFHVLFRIELLDEGAHQPVRENHGAARVVGLIQDHQICFSLHLREQGPQAQIGGQKRYGARRHVGGNAQKTDSFAIPFEDPGEHARCPIERFSNNRSAGTEPVDAPEVFRKLKIRPLLSNLNGAGLGELEPNELLLQSGDPDRLLEDLAVRTRKRQAPQFGFAFGLEAGRVMLGGCKTDQFSACSGQNFRIREVRIDRKRDQG